MSTIIHLTPLSLQGIYSHVSIRGTRLRADWLGKPDQETTGEPLRTAVTDADQTAAYKKGARKMKTAFKTH